MCARMRVSRGRLQFTEGVTVTVEKSDSRPDALSSKRLHTKLAQSNFRQKKGASVECHCQPYPEGE